MSYFAPIHERDHGLLVVSVNQTYPDRTAYDAARFAWKLSALRLQTIDYVVASHNRNIIGVFEPTEWLPATFRNFPEFREDIPDRWAFNGHDAPQDVANLFVGLPLPAGLKLSQHGIRYAGSLAR